MSSENLDKVLQESVERLHEIFERSDLEIECRKIQKKLEEAKYDQGSLRPLVDCIFSLFIAARSRGYNPESVLNELEKVAVETLGKHWKKMPDGTYQSF